MSRFLRVLIAVTAAVHLPFVAAVGYFCTIRGWHSPWMVAWLAGAAGVLCFVWRARAAATDKRAGHVMSSLVDTPYFIHWCACMWSMFPALGSLFTFPIVELVRHEPLAWPLRFYFWTYVPGLVVCAYGILVRRKWFVVKELEVKLRGLDPKLDGYRIAHLSDLHIGTMTPRERGEKWARAANARTPDLAVVTGDMVTSGTAYHEDIAEVIGGLRAKDGVFVSMGNHDYFGDGEPLISSCTHGAPACFETRERCSSGTAPRSISPGSTTPGRSATTSSARCATDRPACRRSSSRTIRIVSLVPWSTVSP